MEREYQVRNSIATHHEGTENKLEPKTVQRYHKQTRSRKNRATADRTLWVEPLSQPCWHQEFSILTVRIRKRDSGALSPGVPKLQRRKEKAYERSWRREHA